MKVVVLVDDSDDLFVLQITREARESVLAAMFQHDIPLPFVPQTGLTTS